MDYRKAVEQVTRSMKVLGPNDQLLEMDSLKTVDFVMELEDVCGVLIPSNKLRREVFASVDSVAGLLEQLAREG